MNESDVPAGARMAYSPIGALDYLEASRARLEDAFLALQAATRDLELRVSGLERVIRNTG